MEPSLCWSLCTLGLELHVAYIHRHVCMIMVCTLWLCTFFCMQHPFALQSFTILITFSTGVLNAKPSPGVLEISQLQLSSAFLSVSLLQFGVSV